MKTCFAIAIMAFVCFLLIGCDEITTVQQTPGRFIDPQGRFEIIMDEADSVRLIGTNTAVIHFSISNTMETSVLRLQGLRFAGDVYSLEPSITLGMQGEYTILAHQNAQSLNELALGIEDWWDPTGTLIAPGNELKLEIRMPTTMAKKGETLDFAITEVNLRFGSDPAAQAIGIYNINVSHTMEKKGVVDAELSPFSPIGASMPSFQLVLQVVISNDSVEPLVITDLSLQLQWQDAVSSGWLENGGLVIASDQYPSSMYEQWGNLGWDMFIILDIPLIVPAKGTAVLEVYMNTTGASASNDDWLQVDLLGVIARYQYSHNAFGWWMGIGGGRIQY